MDADCKAGERLRRMIRGSVICSYDDGGLPIGLQIVDRGFDDPAVLPIVLAFEAMWAEEAGRGRSRRPPDPGRDSSGAFAKT
jgi:Asp-tRNA(Asn)/Glu-tRNA(Gln) amidotransferase A subunit family amidase